MKKIIILALAAVVCGAVANSQPENAPEGPRGMVREIIMELMHLRKEAAIEEDQRAEIKGILKSHRSEIATQFKAARDARHAMQDAVEAKGQESAEAMQAVDAIAATARSRALLVAKIATEIRPVLTPEQMKLAKATRERTEDMVDERMAKFGE